MIQHKLLVLSASLGLIVANSLPAWSKELASYEIGNWTVGAYADNNTGQFTHCGASGDYQSGITLFVILSTSGDMSLMFGRNDWRLNMNKQYSVGVRYDGSEWSYRDAVPIDEKAFAIDMGAASTAADIFSHANELEILVGRQTFGFGLKGSLRLMEGLSQCVKNYASDASPSSTAINNEPEHSDKQSKYDQSASGTGILVSNDGEIITNNHVVDGCKNLEVIYANDVPREAHVIKADRSNDLSLIKSVTSPSGASPAEFRGTPVRAGEAIAVFGFPLSGTLSSSGNIVTGNVTALAGMNDDARLYQISAPIQPGNSGGPLLDMSGHVIGLVTSKLDELVVASKIGTLPQNVNFAIKGEIARSFLQAYAVDFRTTDSTASLSTPEVVDAARKFTVQVLCNP